MICNLILEELMRFEHSLSSLLNEFELMSIDHALSREKRIIGGSNAKISEFPFLVQIYERTVNRYKFICGGTIIHRRFVLTAAHCFVNYDTDPIAWTDEKSLKIVTGTTTKGGKDGHEYKVKQYYIHPNFDVSSGANDIALIKVYSEMILDLKRDRMLKI